MCWKLLRRYNNRKNDTIDVIIINLCNYSKNRLGNNIKHYFYMFLYSSYWELNLKCSGFLSRHSVLKSEINRLMLYNISKSWLTAHFKEIFLDILDNYSHKSFLWLHWESSVCKDNNEKFLRSTWRSITFYLCSEMIWNALISHFN